MTNWKEHGVPFEDFTKEITQQWIEKGFSKEECKEWLDTGLKAEDSGFCIWLRDVENKNVQWLLNFGNKELLKREFNNYLRKIVDEYHLLIMKSEEKGIENKINVRNILLFGWMGGGKSTLANVLAETKEFEESAGIGGKTKKTKRKNFKYKGTNYQVIDTAGAGDPKSSKKGFLNEIVSNIYTKDGINQIFFVLGGRISEGEINTYNSFKKTIFDKDIDKFVTIVRTNFPGFNDEQKCLEERGDYKRNFKERLGISNIIFVDNPSNDPLKKREVSRSILLEHLINCQEIYRPKKMLIDFANIDFFNLETEQEKHLLNLEKLEELKIENKDNKKGSLKSLLNVTKLKKLDIRGTTGIESGLEYLPDSCETFLCDSNSKAAKVLIKYGSNEKYNIALWKKDIRSVLENSYNTKNDIRRFFGSWSKKEISKLKDDRQLAGQRYFFQSIEWIPRVSLITAGILSLTNLGGYGDIINPYIGIPSIVYPFMEAIASHWKDWHYYKNEERWELFVWDSRKLWNDYQELVEFLEPFELADDSTKKNEFSNLNHKLWNLREKVIEIAGKLKQSKEKDEVETDLVTKKQFAKDLQKNWVERERKWREIGEGLVEINSYQQESQGDIQWYESYSNKTNNSISLLKNNNQENNSEIQKEDTRINIETSSCKNDEEIKTTGRRVSFTTPKNRRKSISYKKIPKQEGEIHELTELNIQEEENQSQVNIEIPPKSNNN